MSANESDHLEFRGADLKECEQFIAAVNKRARAQGKLRDDQWIADFVAVCMAENALAWWSALDEETQGSWRLLRQAMFTRFRPVFYGKSGTEAEDFVDQICQRALNMGKLEDPQWTAKFASVCFKGAALRWYLLLDPSVRGNWDALQVAILTRYGHEIKEDSTAPITPTPASAASPPVSIPRRHRGRIRASTKGNTKDSYLSRNLGNGTDQEGRIMMSSVLAEALEVEYEVSSASNGPLALIIPNDQIKGCNKLGLKWYRVGMTLGSNEAVPCGVDSNSGVGSPGPLFTGTLWTTAWTISSSPKEQDPKQVTVVTESGTRMDPILVGKQLLFQSPSRWGLEYQVELFFEPL